MLHLIKYLFKEITYEFPDNMKSKFSAIFNLSPDWLKSSGKNHSELIQSFLLEIGDYSSIDD